MIILGLKYGHDAGAALLRDGAILAAAAEERFSRVKHDASFPFGAVAYCLAQAGIEARDVDVLAYPSEAPAGAHLAPCVDLPDALGPAPDTGKTALPVFLPRLGLRPDCRVHACHHHRAHAACAYHLSGANGGRRLVFTMDGVGDGVSLAVWEGVGAELRPLYQCGPQGSLGWFYSLATEALGYYHGDGEGTVMALAAFGSPDVAVEELRAFCPSFVRGELDRPHEFGAPGVFPDHGSRLYSLREAPLLVDLAARLGRENLAAGAQALLEAEIEGIVSHWTGREDCRAACFSGGVFLNVKLNQKLWVSGLLDEQFLFPDAGDSGLPLGAAVDAHFALADAPGPVAFPSVYLGPGHGDDAVRALLDERKLSYEMVDDPALAAADILERGGIVGWFQGRMEVGPRALGARSILMRPDNAENKTIINRHVKFRDEFRPFCPSMPAEAAGDVFTVSRYEPHMITAFEVRDEMRAKLAAVCHVDGTARPQMVRAEDNPDYHRLLGEMHARTGVPALLNTSFNIKGEPIVAHPREAIRCFFDTGMDALVLGRAVLRKPGSSS